MTIYASGSRGTSDQFKGSVALEHYLAIVTYFSNVRPILVKAHGTDEEHLAVLNKAGERTEDLFAPRRHPGPISEKTLRRVVAFEHVTVSALEFANHSVIKIGSNDQPILWSLGQFRTFGCKHCWRDVKRKS